MDLKNAKILLTGGSSGIGEATAKLLAEKGASVFINGLETDKTAKVISDLQIGGICTDLRTDSGIEKTFATAIKYLGGIDVLINNAGIAYRREVGKLTRADFYDMMDTNVIAPALLAQKALPFFKTQGYGHIVNIGATGGDYGFKGGSVYGSSKAALANMSKCWQVELRPHNIRVIHINPSWVSGTTNNAGEYISEQPDKLSPSEIAHPIIFALQMNNRGFIPELNVVATNPQ